MKSKLEIIGWIVMAVATALAVASYARSLIHLSKAAASEQFAQNIIESAPWPMIVCDEQGKVVIWNKACETFTGWPAKVMLHGTVARIVPPAYKYDHESAFSGANKRLRESDQEWTPSIERPIQVQCRDGRLVDTKIMIRGVKSGNRVLFIAAIQPVVSEGIVEQLKAGQTDRWNRSDTLQWLEEFGRLNPGVKMPDIEKIGK